jgi:hypothetical protein
MKNDFGNAGSNVLNDEPFAEQATGMSMVRPDQGGRSEDLASIITRKIPPRLAARLKNRLTRI